MMTRSGEKKIRYNKLRKKKKGDNVPVTDGDSLI